MEKSKTNKKSKSLIVMLVAILLCIAVVLGMGGFTYAKYISSKTVTTQTANVAKWGYVISVNESKLFSTGYSGGAKVESPSASTCDVYTTATTSVVAPGTSGSMTFSVTGSAEVRSAIKIEANYVDGTTYTTVQLKNSSDTVIYEPIKWTLKKGDGTLVDGGTYDTLIETLKKQADGTTTINPGDEQDLSYTLSWVWEFESGNDEYDTILGQLANGDTVDGYTANTTVSLDLKITVQQVQNT